MSHDSKTQEQLIFAFIFSNLEKMWNERNLRNSGIDVVGSVPWGTHICQFYSTKEDLTDILIPYFKQGWKIMSYVFGSHQTLWE